MNSIRRYINLVEALDNSQAARMQRARDQGFDVENPHYHGTPAGDFENFDHERVPDENLAYGKGVYASRDPDAASGYVKPGSSWGNADAPEDVRPTVYKVLMKVLNPFDMDRAYLFPEVKRIFEHCFDKNDLENIEVWHDACEETVPRTLNYEEYEEIDQQLSSLEGATTHPDIDPEDYDDGDADPEYIADVDAALDDEEKSLKRRIARLERDQSEWDKRHAQAIAMGRIGSVRGRDIYKALWQNTGGYYDWKAESQLFGGETDTIEFKSEANRWLEELGYDGLRHQDHYNPGAKGRSHSVTIAFRPEQVRSVHANFDPDKAGSANMSEGVQGSRQYAFLSTLGDKEALSEVEVLDGEWKVDIRSRVARYVKQAKKFTTLDGLIIKKAVDRKLTCFILYDSAKVVGFVELFEHGMVGAFDIEISLEQEYRRKGLGYSLYKMLLAHGYRLVCGYTQYPGSQSIWKKLIADAQVKVQTVTPSNVHIHSPEYILKPLRKGQNPWKAKNEYQVLIAEAK